MDLFDVFDAPPATSLTTSSTAFTPGKRRANEPDNSTTTTTTASSSASSSAASSSQAPQAPRYKRARSSKSSSNTTSTTSTTSTTTTTTTTTDVTPTESATSTEKMDSSKDTDESSSETPIEGTEDTETDDSQSSHAELLKACQHEVLLPPNYDEEAAKVRRAELRERESRREPARKYPFVLDPFQKAAVSCLEQDESVLVSAHTSAGKTVVAEYAIAMALRDGQRVIYTSPIKALSNQKFRELQEEFSDVGLMTGDVTINPSASCIVMTTEILRSMLYRGSEVMREVAWVVFDEIHYMRDKERGVVWEEVIILLPHSCHFVFLSATIPNAREFAEWVAHLHAQPCHVVYTDYRPTPLQHYIFPEGGSGIHLVVDEKSHFREDNFQRALSSLAMRDDTPARRQKRSGPGGQTAGKGRGPSDIYKIIKMIMERRYQPVIIFSFSKKECEALALQMSKLDFNDEDEKELVHSVFQNAIDSLGEDDRQLPQVEHILPLLKRGIGIHHSGLLPILKEVIEILFQEGLLKALFATETFAMGLNMPARTVVFTSVRKFDGQNFRFLTGGEYIQMSGRAGRRGLDDRGIVILMVDEKMEPAVAKQMLLGQADPLNSQFHLTYNMLLNLMRVEGVDPEYLIKRSFHQFQSDRKLPEYEKKYAELTEQCNSIVIPDESNISNYYHLNEQLEQLRDEVRHIVNQPIYVLPFLLPGRLVRVRQSTKCDWGWGVVVNFQKVQPGSKANSATLLSGETTSAQVSSADEPQYVVDILLRCRRKALTEVASSSAISSSSSSSSSSSTNATSSSLPKPLSLEEEEAGTPGELLVIPVLLPLLNGVSSIRVYIPKDLRSPESRRTVANSLREVHRRYPDGLPLLDPVSDLQIKDPTFARHQRKVEALEERLAAHPLLQESAATAVADERQQSPSGPSQHRLSEQSRSALQLYAVKMQLGAEAKEVRRHLRRADTVIMKEELKSMQRVLRRLGHITRENVIDVKGRVTCEINANDELLLTELMFSGSFTTLSPSQIASLLSCFVFQEKGGQNQRMREELAEPLRRLHEQARRVARIGQECKLPVNPDEYVEHFRPGLMEVVHRWAGGAKFVEICRLTDVFEGSVIRSMRRLEELLRQLATAARSIGNGELENKFGEAITLIKRDIIFAASLYLA